MKRHLPLAAVLILALASLSFAQEAAPSPAPKKPSAPRVTKAQLLKQLSDLDTQLWEAFKKKDPLPFETHLAADAVVVGDAGVYGKKDIAGGIAGCDVTSFSLSDWKLTKFGANTALLTYKGKQSGTCGGAPMPATVWVSSIWMKRKGVWVSTFHQESAAHQ